MSNGERRTVYFDPEVIGLERASGETRLDRLAPYPSVIELCESLRDDGVQLGVLTFDPGLDVGRIEKSFEGASLTGLFDMDRVVVGTPGAAPPLPPGLGPAFFVGVRADDRRLVRDAGLEVVAHPVLLRRLMDDDPPVFARLSVGGPPTFPWSELIGGLPIAWLMPALEPEPVLYVLAARMQLGELPREIGVRVLGDVDDAALSNLYLIQLDTDGRRPGAGRGYHARLARELSFVLPTPRGVIVPLPGNLADHYHPPGAAHGHTAELVPSDLPVATPLGAPDLVPRPLTPDEHAALSSLQGGALDGHLGAVAGRDPLGETGPIVSRHTDHSDNPRITSWLEAALNDILGAGRAWKHPAGPADNGDSRFNVLGEIPGTSQEVVVVGAHLDSTAQRDDGYTAATHPAPGADDDASGVAAVLAAAQVLKALSDQDPPERRILFGLFNREEQGRWGSKRYAQALKAFEVPVVAMFQMDMIGYSDAQAPPLPFEVHGTGALDYPAVYAKSGQLVQVLTDAARQVADGVIVPDVYPKPGCSRDPSAARSDHSSFHLNDFPAVLASEDLFDAVCPPGATQTGNPMYHQGADTAVDLDYAAAIARSVAAAAWMLAKPSASSVSLTPGPVITPGPQPIVIADPVDPDPITSTPSTPTLPDPSTPTVSTPQTAGGTGPMPNKFIVEFLARWIRDEAFRCAVLHEEITTLQNEGYTTKQIDILTGLNKEAILTELVRELEEDLGIELDVMENQVWGFNSRAAGNGTIANPANPTNPNNPNNPGGGPTPIVTPTFTPAVPLDEPARRGGMVTREFMMFAVTMARNVLYSEGNVHLRSTDPSAVDEGDKRMITVRGQGIDPATDPEVRFTFVPPDGNAPTVIDGNVKAVRCDVDIYQRIEVKVELDKKGPWQITARNPGGDWSEPISIMVV